MDEQKFYQILDKLVERTKEGKLEWETTINNNTFLTALKETAISVTKMNDDCYSFDFINEKGDVFDTELVSVKDFPIEAFTDNTDNIYLKAQRIFELAKSQSVRKSEQNADRILEELTA